MAGENFDVIVEIITQVLVIFLDKETMKIWKKQWPKKRLSRGHIFSRVGPFYERAVSNLDP